MERLTERDEYGNANIIGVNGAELKRYLDLEAIIILIDALNRLAEFEDSGLTPAECALSKWQMEVIRQNSISIKAHKQILDTVMLERDRAIREAEGLRRLLHRSGA